MGGKKSKGGGGKGGGGDAKRIKNQSEAQAPYEEGERGFLISASSCQRAQRGAKDLRLWLEVEAEKTPHAIVGTSTSATSSCDTATCTTAGAGLDAELAELRGGGEDIAVKIASMRFLSTGMVCQKVAWLKLQDSTDVPSTLADQFLSLKAKKRFASRFAERVFPVDRSSRPKLESFRELGAPVLAPHKGKSWRLVFEPFRGGWNTVTRDDALALCKEHLVAEDMSVSEPEVTVFCTLTPRFVGLAALVGMDVDDLRVEEEDDYAN